MSTDPKTLKTSKAGLVPCEILISEAGLGLRKGEVRGLSPEMAAAMIDKKQAVAVDPVDEPDVKKAAKTAATTTPPTV